jgi:hypothetical protein
MRQGERIDLPSIEGAQVAMAKTPKATLKPIPPWFAVAVEMAIGVALLVAGMIVGTGMDWVFLVGSALPVQP